MPSPVFLLGSMGAGKSVVGRELAQRTHAVFIDLDVRIERITGQSIAGLFERGEAEFRRCERAALVSLLAEPGFRSAAAVVATGGGIVGDPTNLAAIHEVGRSVYLRASVATLVERLDRPPERERRPLLAGVDLQAQLTELLSVRETAYASATITVDADSEVSDVVDAIVAALG